VRTERRAVRREIGVALQEAALDPFLGREHMTLQGGLHGLAADEIKRRGDALLDRVGRPGRSPVVCRGVDCALAFAHNEHPLAHNEASPEVSGARRRRASPIFWRVFGEFGRRDLAC
jgi:hypothetical protein